MTDLPKPQDETIHELLERVKNFLENVDNIPLSLNALIERFNEFRKCSDFWDYQEYQKIIYSLHVYKDFCTQYKGDYYLYGQVPTSPDKPITFSMLQEAYDANCKKLTEYGGPCNFCEISRAKSSEETFRNLILSIELYHKMYIEITYAPGGSGFQEAKEDFEELSEYTFTNNT